MGTPSHSHPSLMCPLSLHPLEPSQHPKHPAPHPLPSISHRHSSSCLKPSGSTPPKMRGTGPRDRSMAPERGGPVGTQVQLCRRFTLSVSETRPRTNAQRSRTPTKRSTLDQGGPFSLPLCSASPPTKRGPHAGALTRPRNPWTGPRTFQYTVRLGGFLDGSAYGDGCTGERWPQG